MMSIKDTRIFKKNEKNNLSTSHRLFCNFQKTFENFRKTYVMYSNYKIKKLEYLSVSIHALII
jgi:hypothetical protein